VFSRASQTSSASVSTEDALSRARSYQESARKLEELSQQLSRDASWAESHGMQLSTNLSQDLANWYRAQQAANPGLDAPEIWATDLSEHQRSVRDEMVQRWMSEKREAIYEEIRGSLNEPDLVDVHRTDVSSAADVRATYHPHGAGGIPAGPSAGDPGAAAAVISSGKAALDGDRAAAQAGRASNMQGASRIQSEVNAGHDKGFFLNPELRK
jgi:conjugal transfer mating pair stabilization protein TraG